MPLTKIPLPKRNSLSEAVQASRAAGQLAVQPRMGFSDRREMAAGLRAVRAAGSNAIGTITLDSYTRVGDYPAAERALAGGNPLNGYPLLAHGAGTTRQLLAELGSPTFPVQLRHGSPQPVQIFQAMLAAGITASEGGPVSYCLPYGNRPLDQSVAAWSQACQLLAQHDEPVHLETFGGCMLGQLCPPSLLVALSVLEAIFFAAHGIASISLSYAQQTHSGQDLAALRALRLLATEYLPADRYPVDWHIVVYTYMGLYPQTAAGARLLLADSARLAESGGADRLIVKTVAESSRIPTVTENVAALRLAGQAGREQRCAAGRPAPVTEDDEQVYEQARTFVQAVLSLAEDVGTALLIAFRRGVLDVPYCLHQDNRKLSRARLDDTGRLVWTGVGRMPITGERRESQAASSSELMQMLSYQQRRYDLAAAEHIALSAG